MSQHVVLSPNSARKKSQAPKGPVGSLSTIDLWVGPYRARARPTATFGPWQKIDPSTGPGLVSAELTIVEGHGVWEAAKELGVGELACIVVDHLTANELRLLRIALNRIGELGDWEPEALRLEFEELIELGEDVVLSGFETAEVDALLLDDDDQAVEDQAEVLSSVGANSVSQSGDLWLLGGHRLLQGDARDRTAYAHSRLDRRRIYRRAGQRRSSPMAFPGPELSGSFVFCVLSSTERRCALSSARPPGGRTVELSEARLPSPVRDAYNLTMLRDSDFDVVCLNSVFHRLPEKTGPLQEFARVLKPGGRLGMSTALGGRPSLLREAATKILARLPFADCPVPSGDVIYRVTEQEMRDLLESAGFRVTRLDARAVVRQYATPEDAIRFSEASTFGNFLRHLPEGLRPRARDEIKRELEARMTSEGLREERHRLVTVALRS